MGESERSELIIFINVLFRTIFAETVAQCVVINNIVLHKRSRIRNKCVRVNFARYFCFTRRFSG